jgi:hypothetical protein
METIQGACSCLCPTVDTFQWGTFWWGVLAGAGVLSVLAVLGVFTLAFIAANRH